jgi:hypothetical protein
MKSRTAPHRIVPTFEQWEQEVFDSFSDEFWEENEEWIQDSPEAAKILHVYHASRRSPKDAAEAIQSKRLS